MHLYYTHNYRSEKGESHRLLAKAAAVYLYDSDHNDAAFTEAHHAYGSAENLISHHDDMYICDLDARSSCMNDVSLQKYMDRADELVGRMQRDFPDGNTKQSGKPFIPGFAPFSISHSGKTWAVLMLDDPDSVMTCGLDIQYRRKADAAGIASRFFAPEDAELIAAVTDSVFICNVYGVYHLLRRPDFGIKGTESVFTHIFHFNFRSKNAVFICLAARTADNTSLAVRHH